MWKITVGYRVQTSRSGCFLVPTSKLIHAPPNHRRFTTKNVERSNKTGGKIQKLSNLQEQLQSKKPKDFLKNLLRSSTPRPWPHSNLLSSLLPHCAAVRTLFLTREPGRYLQDSRMRPFPRGNCWSRASSWGKAGPWLGEWREGGALEWPEPGEAPSLAAAGGRAQPAGLWGTLPSPPY